MQTKIYPTIQNGETFEGYYEEKKSKFFAFASYVESKAQIDDFLEKISSEHTKARHICFAWRIIEKGQVFQKSSDDGEPSGTAGKPILNIIEKNELYNVCIAVVRYFGGAKLGAGNLLRAYSKSAKMSIENHLAYFELQNMISVKFDAKDFSDILMNLSKQKIDYDTDYENCTIIFSEDNYSKSQKVIDYDSLDSTKQNILSIKKVEHCEK